jgi:hypothetical protein
LNRSNERESHPGKEEGSKVFQLLTARVLSLC